MSNPYTNYVKVHLAEALTNAINVAAQSNPELRLCIAELENRRVGVTVTDFRISVALHVVDGMVLIDNGLNQNELDLLFRGTAANLLKVITSRDWDPQILDNIEIIGDVQLAEKLYKILKKINFDWEEEVAKRVGDIPARQVGNFVRWCKRTIFTDNSPFKQKVRTNLVDENYILPEQSRVEHFLDEVDDLQEDLDRLEKRLDRLDK